MASAKSSLPVPLSPVNSAGAGLFAILRGDLFGPGDSPAGTCYRIKRIFGGMAFVHKPASKLYAAGILHR